MKKKNLINWTKPMLERFRKDYQQAVQDNQPEFVFDGNRFVTGYAKYLIEYLDLKFEGAQ